MEAVPDNGNLTAVPLPEFKMTDNALSGRLILSQGRAGIIAVDLATGDVRLLYVPPREGLVVSSAAHPDGSLIMLAYAPSPTGGEIQLGFTDLYLLPADGSGPPEVYMAPANENEFVFNPTWSPDGKMLYYGHVIAPENPGQASKVTLERIAFPDGDPEIVLEDAFWPAISPDGAHIAYVKFDRFSGQEELVISNADTTEPMTLVPSHTFDAIDAMLFSPDGQAILFIASTFEETTRNRMPDWLLGLLGVQVVRAHDAPGDLWTVSITGGQPRRLTTLLGDQYDTGLFARRSIHRHHYPGQHIYHARRRQ